MESWMQVITCVHREGFSSSASKKGVERQRLRLRRDML